MTNKITNIFSKKLLTKKKCSYIITSNNEQSFCKRMGDYMKIKIVNIRKFIISLSISLAFIFLLFVLFNNSYSKGDIRYKNEYILEGDTIWKIAEREAKNNKYYENKDIRNIVKEIKDINNINNEVLHIGDKINIPTY